MTDLIRIINASENNLKSVSIDIPKNKLVVVTGISGSGKSSLVFDVLYRGAENLYLGSFSSYARQFLGRMKKPAVEKVDGLSPAIVVDQKAASGNIRSTVGTVSEIWDYLRLLYARIGKPDSPSPDLVINRSLFSFNSPAGACPYCKGLGVEDRLDPDLLIADETKSIRDRALVITAPNGYIIYSQVTMDVLDQVCKAEGFSVDIPWKELTVEQKHIILYGSDKIEIPFGKHTLESRMRWSGITAKPREMGYYKGIIPVMETILKRERNKNILRFVRTNTCSHCQGTRLNEKALSVRIEGRTISDLATLPLNELKKKLLSFKLTGNEKLIADPVIWAVTKKIDLVRRLGLGYLTTDRTSFTLSSGEAQRLKLATIAGIDLSGALYIFDEPSVGLHPRDTIQLIDVLKELRDKGNSVIVVEHEEEFIRHADWIIDLGPGAGNQGGNILFSMPAEDIDGLSDKEIRKSRTLSFLKGIEKMVLSPHRRKGAKILEILGARHHNLKDINVGFRLEALNVVTGVSGAGKSSLVNDILGNFLKHKLHRSAAAVGSHREIRGWENISRVISVDQSPIGRTPRSNPATYTGLSDLLRDLYAELPEAKNKGLGKTNFSFNTEGGRCESCGGAGYLQIGMHFMGNVEVPCEKCEGKRFNDETLSVTYRQKNISEVLEMTVDESMEFFKDQPRILRFLDTMNSLGLGYLTLGQRSSTLSGGEAQRVKLATELARPQSGHTLYLLDEPTTGLHSADISMLIRALNQLIDLGNTVILIEHHPGLILQADHVTDLGPESGNEGGYLVAAGTPEEIARCKVSWTGRALASPSLSSQAPPPLSPLPLKGEGPGVGTVTFKGVTTNNLQHIDVSIPKNKITVITGVSGSGKSSFAFDTLYTEGMNRYLESFSAYARTQIGIKDKADFEEVSGLTPALALEQKTLSANKRSTVGTMTGIYDFIRLLFSRLAKSENSNGPVLSSLFSFNHQHGACPSCDGLGYKIVCDPDKLITHPELSILSGAMNGTKTGKFYGDPKGQYISALKTAGKKHGIDFTKSWIELTLNEKKVAMYGTGEDIFDVTWEYQRGNRTGKHHFKGKWKGIVNLVNEEYTRKHADHRGEEMINLMKEETCNACQGKRLSPEALSFTLAGQDIAMVTAFPIQDAINYFIELSQNILTDQEIKIADPVITEILQRLNLLSELALSYLTLDRKSTTLSTGESQRIRLAGQIGSNLTNIIYVLDEPTMGLHPSDIRKMMKTIRQLKEKGNTVVIVEHDRKVILEADHVIEFGPGAGINGGRLIFAGTPAEMKLRYDSITARYLDKKNKNFYVRNRVLRPGLTIKNATANNLKGFDLEIPAGGIVLITGVSGSGKSTLLFDVILSSREKGKPSGCSSITGFDNFQKVIPVHQKISFSGPAGVVATYTGIFDSVRELFAKTEDAVKRNLVKSHFSFTRKEGQCDECSGSGRIKISMDFLSDVFLICEKCGGSRFKEEVLDCIYNGKNISEVLHLTVSEAAGFFETHKTLAAQLRMMEKVGLGYLQLGQSLDTLSGGESQRLILATDLMNSTRGNTLYLLEEPSTGLHFRDIEYLMKLFHEMADKGYTLLIIDNDPDVLIQADWIIGLGPGGGDLGGKIISEGRVTLKSR